MFLLTLVVFVVILGLFIFVHEFGHFILAKTAGVKVEEFAFGFPPKLICRKRGETKYCLNLIPFGGYVKMLGEEGGSDSSRSFAKKPTRWRLAIIVAGVVANFLVAGLLFSFGYMVGITPIGLNPAQLGGRQTHQVVVAEVLKDSSAALADIKVGDIIVGFDSVTGFRTFTAAHLGQEASLTISRAGETLTKSVVLSANTEAPLGVGVADAPIVRLGFFRAFSAGFREMVMTTAYVAQLLWDFLVGIFKEGKVSAELSGPVGIFSVTGQAVRMGFGYVVQLAAVLSINLALINILPFPALDGGKAVILFSEGIFRRKLIRQEVENILHTVGFALLILLIMAVTIREILALL